MIVTAEEKSILRELLGYLESQDREMRFIGYTTFITSKYRRMLNKYYVVVIRKRLFYNFYGGKIKFHKDPFKFYKGEIPPFTLANLCIEGLLGDKDIKFLKDVD